MIASTAIFLLLCVQDADYARMSESYGLDGPDEMMRQGRYLEAAVVYRNRVVESEGRDALRIPLSFALLGTGDVDFAGKQIRCAQLLFDDFERFRFDPETLFPSKSAWKDLLRGARSRVVTPDGWLFISYASFLGGEKSRAHDALAKYTQWRGGDAAARLMDRMLREDVRERPIVQKKEPSKEKAVGPKISPGIPRSAEGSFLGSSLKAKRGRYVDRKE